MLQLRWVRLNRAAAHGLSSQPSPAQPEEDHSGQLASLFASPLDEQEGNGGNENRQRESDEGEQGLRFDHDDLRFVNDMASALLLTNSLHRHLSDAVDVGITTVEALGALRRTR